MSRPTTVAGAAHPATVQRPAASRRGFALSRAATIAEGETGEGGVAIELRGLRVVVIEGIPEAADEKALLKSLWT